MLHTLHKWNEHITQLPDTQNAHVIQAVHDWIMLGIFTGSRAGEYAQTHTKRDTYSRVPNTPDAGPYANQPLAFMASDFTFYDSNNINIDQRHLWYTANRATRVHICFRYDKSPNNFTIRKFQRSAHPYLCPVKNAISVILRAQQLRVPASAPIAVFKHGIQKRRDHYTYLQSADVVDTMRRVCLKTYPNPNHEIHQQIQQIVAHSNRVTAAVALHNAGMSIDDIAARIRWSRESVLHYLRENGITIDKQTSLALYGALILT
jgi:hypothetical protein